MLFLVACQVFKKVEIKRIKVKARQRNGTYHAFIDWP